MISNDIGLPKSGEENEFNELSNTVFSSIPDKADSVAQSLNQQRHYKEVDVGADAIRELAFSNVLHCCTSLTTYSQSACVRACVCV